MKQNQLTDREIRAAKPSMMSARGKPITQLTDGDGLYLKLFWERPAHSWRFDFKRPDGCRDTMVLGSYERLGTPSTPLALAREKAAELRSMLARGVCPRKAQEVGREAVQKAQEARARIEQGLAPVGSFRHAMELLLEQKAATKAWGTSYTERFKRDLKLRVLPKVGDRQCSTLDTDDFLTIAQELIAGGDHPGAKRALLAAETVMGWAVLNRFTKCNPVSAMGKLDKVIGPKQKATMHHAAQVTPAGVKRVMDLLSNGGNAMIAACAWVHAQTFQRTRNITTMRWADLQLDGDKPQWVIPSELMKRKQEQKRAGVAHVVPLARQTVALLRELRPLTGDGVYVFPHAFEAGESMARNTMNEAIRRVGISETEHTPHGFRSTARTMGDELLHIDPRFLEAHLAHIKGSAMADVTGGMGATYARATHLEERRTMVQTWADYLDHIVHGNAMPARRLAAVAAAPAPAMEEVALAA